MLNVFGGSGDRAMKGHTKFTKRCVPRTIVGAGVFLVCIHVAGSMCQPMVRPRGSLTPPATRVEFEKGLYLGMNDEVFEDYYREKGWTVPSGLKPRQVRANLVDSITPNGDTIMTSNQRFDIVVLQRTKDDSVVAVFELLYRDSKCQLSKYCFTHRPLEEILTNKRFFLDSCEKANTGILGQSDTLK